MQGTGKSGSEEMGPMLLEVMDALNVMAICGYLAGAMLTSGERFTRVLLGWAVASFVLLAADELTGNHWWANFNIGAGASAILLWLYRRQPHAAIAGITAIAEDIRQYSGSYSDEQLRKISEALRELDSVIAHRITADLLTDVPMVCTSCRKPVERAPQVTPQLWRHVSVDDAAACHGTRPGPVKAMVAAGNENVPAAKTEEA